MLFVELDSYSGCVGLPIGLQFAGKCTYAHLLRLHVDLNSHQKQMTCAFADYSPLIFIESRSVLSLRCPANYQTNTVVTSRPKCLGEKVFGQSLKMSCSHVLSLHSFLDHSWKRSCSAVGPFRTRA